MGDNEYNFTLATIYSHSLPQVGTVMLREHTEGGPFMLVEYFTLLFTARQ